MFYSKVMLCTSVCGVLHTYISETLLRTVEISVPPVRMKIMDIHKIYYFNISGLDIPFHVGLSFN